MIYSDIIEYNIVGDTKTLLLRCITFISEVKMETYYLQDSTLLINLLRIYNLRKKNFTA